MRKTIMLLSLSMFLFSCIDEQRNSVNNDESMPKSSKKISNAQNTTKVYSYFNSSFSRCSSPSNSTTVYSNNNFPTIDYETYSYAVQVPNTKWFSSAITSNVRSYCMDNYGYDISVGYSYTMPELENDSSDAPIRITRRFYSLYSDFYYNSVHYYLGYDTTVSPNTSTAALAVFLSEIKTLHDNNKIIKGFCISKLTTICGEYSGYAYTIYYN